MYKETAKLILYRSFGDHSILSELSKIFHDFDAKTAEDAELIERIYTQIKALLDLATSYGFDENLWHNYLTFLLLMNENSFSLGLRIRIRHPFSKIRLGMLDMLIRNDKIIAAVPCLSIFRIIYTT